MLGFVILRTTSDEVWRESYRCIRSIYDSPILIIDRNDEYSILDRNLVNTTIIRTDKNGYRLLSVFFFYKRRPFDTAVLLLDTMFIKKNVIFGEDRLLWITRHDEQETDLEIEILSLLGDQSLTEFYRAGKWVCSYKMCCCISMTSLSNILSKIPLFSVMDLIKNERYASAIDRVFSCILQHMKIVEPTPLFGDIHKHLNYGNYCIGEYNLGIIPDLPVINVWGCSQDTKKVEDTVFSFLSEQQVRSLIGSSRRICLFANYNGIDSISPNTVDYINELCNYYDNVIVIANDTKVYNALDMDKKVKLVHAPNRSYDFGLWSRLVRNMDIDELDEVALVNDSCHITKSLANVIYCARQTPQEFVGLTDNHDIEYHIQSYFLIFKGYTAISRMKSFFNNKNMNITYDYRSAVKEFETTLTTFMKEVVDIKVLYPIDNIHMLRTTGSKIKDKVFDVKHYNSAWVLWDVLISLGCPLLKRKRFKAILDHRDYIDLLVQFGDREFTSSLSN